MALTEAMERRLSLQLLSYWERLRAGRTMPAEQDINPDDLVDLWEHCFLVHAADLDKPDYRYTYLGGALSEWLEGDKSPYVADIINKNCHQVVSGARPVLDEGYFHHCPPGGEEGQVKFRHCLLPLGENGQVLAILGGVRFKFFADS